MAKSIIAILSATLLATQVTFADCETSTIPGYFTDRYTDNGNGTITDAMTNLMWMKCDIDIPWDPSLGTCKDTSLQIGGGRGRTNYTWREALFEAQKANTNGTTGQNDWRLPNVKELSSILALHCISTSNVTALNTDVFDGTAATYWSSTPGRNSTNSIGINPPTNNAWKISFKADNGVGANTTSIEEKYNVRLVRNAP